MNKTWFPLDTSPLPLNERKTCYSYFCNNWTI